MDPDAALRTCRKSAAQVIELLERGSSVDVLDLASASNSLAESFQMLDRWLCQGGYKPVLWIDEDED